MEKLILYNSKIKEAMYGISFIFMRHIICGNFINYINNKEILGIRPKISYMNLALKVGVDDVLLTTYLVPIISTFLAILLPYAVESENIKNIKYKIEPVYNNFFYSVKLDITLDIKIISALNCAFKLYQNKKTQEKKNNIKCNV